MVEKDAGLRKDKFRKTIGGLKINNFKSKIIMETSELRYKGEKFSIRWDPKEEIFFAEEWGAHNKNDATDFIKKMNEMIEKTGIENLYALIDVSRQKSTDHEARRLYSQWLVDKIMPACAAICGSNLVIRIMINFILAAGRGKNKMVKMETFATAEEGLEWLKKMKTKERPNFDK